MRDVNLLLQRSTSFSGQCRDDILLPKILDSQPDCYSDSSNEYGLQPFDSGLKEMLEIQLVLCQFGLTESVCSSLALSASLAPHSHQKMQNFDLS